jgi:hypothetical protein
MRLTCFHSGSCVLLLIAASALPCGQSQQGQSQQNQPQKNPAAAAGPAQASAAPLPADPVRAPEPLAATDSAALLKLATELKAAVDKSNKDTLSLAVIRKADEIERVARGMKDKYRASAAAN